MHFRGGIKIKPQSAFYMPEATRSYRASISAATTRMPFVPS
jgi:hypothetical protein